MNDSVQQKRLAVFYSPKAANVHWVTLDQTGQPPRVVETLSERFDLVSLDDAPISIYRLDDSNDFASAYDRDALAELVKVVNGEPNISADVDEQFRQLREQLQATVDNATETFNKYEEQIAHRDHRIECIIREAREWKAYTRRREADLEQERIRTDMFARNLRQTERELVEARDALQVARNAVGRAVNRSNHSNEHVEAARARTHNAEINASQYASEAAELRRILGAVSAERDDLLGRIVEVQANALDTINRVAAALPEPVVDAEIVEPPFEIVAFYSADGNVPVVEISTTAISGRVRVNLNEGVIWDGDPESDERPGSDAERLPWENIATRDERNLSATVSLQLDTIRDQIEMIERLTAERDAALHERDSLKSQAQAWERVYNHPNLRQFTEEDGVAVEQVMDGISKLAEWRETIREEYVARVAELEAVKTISEQAATSFDTAKGEMLDEIRTLRIERNNARADAEKLREINELQRQGIDESERSRRDALQQRDDLDRKLTESETMRRRLDERLAEERRVYETTSAALRAMLRERDAVLDVAERAAYPTAHGVSAMVAIGEFRAARDRLPKLETEEYARNDDSIRKMITAVDQAVRLWRLAPTNVMTEQLNIALSNLADSIPSKP